MKYSARYALLAALLVPFACKNKDKSPDAAAPATPAVTSATPIAANAPPVALDAFEGKIAVTAQGKFDKAESAGPMNFTLRVKDGKFRVDLPESLTASKGMGKANLLVMPADKKLYAILDDKKQAVLIDLDKLATQAKAFGHARAPNKAGAATPPEFTKTGKTDTVAGYKCEIWHFAHEKSEGEVCVAEQGTSWFHIPLSGAPAELAWASELTDGKHFPLRLVLSEAGVEKGRVEVTRIDKQALPAADFEVPAGYAVLGLDQMLGALMGGALAGGVSSGGTAVPGLPPGIKLPPGIELPPGFQLPKH